MFCSCGMDKGEMVWLGIFVLPPLLRSNGDFNNVITNWSTTQITVALVIATTRSIEYGSAKYYFEKTI